jgi:prolyl oligopeptidase
MSTSTTTASTTAPTVPWTPNRYPPSRRSDHVEVYKSAKNGEVKVPDPYVWLEENTPETEEWVSAQEKFTREYLDQLPDRERLEKSIRENTDYPRVSTSTEE